MQNIEVNDQVQLTASMLIGLASEQPAIFKQLVETGRAGGKVLSIDQHSITIDMTPQLSEPLTVELDSEHSHLAVQLVRKAEKATTATTKPQVAVQVIEQPCQVNGKPTMLPFPASLFAVPLRQPEEQQPVPERVRMSQWVMTQFLHFKQYGIAQDLSRTDDEKAVKGEDWSGKEYRPVQVELTPPETMLYNTAIARITQWLKDDKAVPPVVPDTDEITVSDGVEIVHDSSNEPTSNEAGQ